MMRRTHTVKLVYRIGEGVYVSPPDVRVPREATDVLAVPSRQAMAIQSALRMAIRAERIHPGEYRQTLAQVATVPLSHNPELF